MEAITVNVIHTSNIKQKRRELTRRRCTPACTMNTLLLNQKSLFLTYINNLAFYRTSYSINADISRCNFMLLSLLELPQFATGVCYRGSVTNRIVDIHTYTVIVSDVNRFLIDVAPA